MQVTLASLRDAPSKLKSALQIRLALSLVWESASYWTLASIALVLIQGSLPLASLYLMKRIVDSLDPSSQLMQAPRASLLFCC